MSNGKPRDPAKEQLWRRRLLQWQGSGLSVRDFCHEHDLSEASFYAWRRTLAQRDAEAPAFLPVEILPEPTTPTGTANASGLELLLPAGRVLRIGPGFDEPTLRRLLALLEEGRP